MVHVYPFLPLTDSSLTHSNLAAVMETVEVWLGYCLRVPDSVQVKLRQQCDNGEERRNELISWWLQSSPYALDSWKWLSGQLLYRGEESALAAAKRYIHQTPGMSVVNQLDPMHACVLGLGDNTIYRDKYFHDNMTMSIYWLIVITVQMIILFIS